MIYIESPSTDPAFNLALEQHIFDSFDRTHEYFMLWQNAGSVIVGKNQNTVGEIDSGYVDRHGIRVIRRLSGGGAVYHDLGNLNFTFIMDGGDQSQLDLRLFCEPVAKMLRSLGVDAEVNGRNDITIDGKKFSGNSQYIKKGRVMHHGTIMFDSNLETVAKALRVPKDKIRSKGLKSVQSRITNVREYLEEDISLERFKELLMWHIFGGKPTERYILTDDDIKAAKALKEERYGTWDWNYGESPKYTIRKERRIPGCGKLELYMDIESGRLRAIRIYGDYFGVADTSELESALVGRRAEYDEYKRALSAFDIGKFFYGLTEDEFLGLLAY